MKVNTIMRPPRAILGPHTSVADALAKIQEHKVGGLPVLDPHGLLMGMATTESLSASRSDKALMDITQRLAPILITATPDMDVGRVIEMMDYKHLRNIMVVEGRTLVGAFSIDEARAALQIARAA